MWGVGVLQSDGLLKITLMLLDAAVVETSGYRSIIQNTSQMHASLLRKVARQML